jgi:hypothetical protein
MAAAIPIGAESAIQTLGTQAKQQPRKKAHGEH